MVVLFGFAHEGGCFVSIFYYLVGDLFVVVGVLVLDEFAYFSAKSRMEALCGEA